MPGLGLTGMLPLGGGPPTVVTRNTSTGNGTSLSVALPASLVSLDGIIVAIGYGYSSGTPTLSTPAGWSALTTYGPTGSIGGYFFYKTSNGSEGSTLTVTASGTASWGATSFQISGWPGTPRIGTAANGTNANPDPPSVTPTSASSLVLALTGGAGASTTVAVAGGGYPSGYSNGQIGAQTTGGVRGYCASAEKMLSSMSPEDPGTYTLTSASVVWWAQTIIVDG